MPQTWQHLHQRAGKQFSHFVFTRSCIKERVQRRIKSEKLQFWQKLKVTTFFFLLLLSCRLFSNDTQSFANVGWHDWVLAFCLKWCQNALQRVTWVSANINCNLFYFSRLHWTSVVPLHYRLRPIESVQFRFDNLGSHFIRVLIFQIDFLLTPSILSASKYF